MNNPDYDPKDIKLGDFFKHIDKSQTNNIIDQVEACMKEKNKSSEERQENVEKIGQDMHKDFFYYRKQKEGHYQYFLFPTIDKNLIEDQGLMKTYDRNKYISKVVELQKK